MLQAAPGWRAVELISDLHLHPADEATAAAWRRYLGRSTADALFILGDLFEAWVGDDAARQPGFAAGCAAALAAASARRPVYLMHGNRDFLLGAGFAAQTGTTLLHDPTTLAFGGRRWLLTHGDQLCLADTDYLAYRAQVRADGWRAAFLARPLTEREAVARAMREASQTRQQAQGPELWADVDDQAARGWLAAAQAQTLVHGHTHRTATHELGAGLRRIVLSDWDAQAHPPRLEALRIDAHGRADRVPLD